MKLTGNKSIFGHGLLFRDQKFIMKVPVVDMLFQKLPTLCGNSDIAVQFISKQFAYDRELKWYVAGTESNEWKVC